MNTLNAMQLASSIQLRVTPSEFSDIQTMVEQANAATARGESTAPYYEQPMAERLGDRAPELKLATQGRRVVVELIVDRQAGGLCHDYDDAFDGDGCRRTAGHSGYCGDK